MKVALYARVSLDETDKDSRRYQEPENQLVPLRDFAKALNCEVYAEYIDRESGKNPNRPKFRLMLQDAALRRFNGILVWKLDRFSREGTINTHSYIKQLRERGIWLKSLNESWLDTSNQGVGDLLISIFGWVAEQESRNISDRTKAGIRRLRAIGQWKGGRPPKKGEGLLRTEKTSTR